MRTRLAFVPLALCLAALSGCGADGILPEDPAAGEAIGKPLTEAEAWSAVYNQPIVQHPPYYSPPGQPTGHPVVTTTEPCRFGGERTERLESSGGLAPEEYLVSRYAKEITSRACAYPIWKDGPVITVTSTPLQKVDFTLNVPVVGTGPSRTGCTAGSTGPWKGGRGAASTTSPTPGREGRRWWSSGDRCAGTWSA